MSFTIEWLITQDIIPGFTLLCGSLNSINISGVNIMDNPDTIPWVQEGTVLLSTGYLIDDDISKNLVKDLMSRGCAGLGIKMNRYINELPPQMIEQAEKYNFPIFNIPFTCSLQQVVDIIYHHMHIEEIDATQKMAIIYKSITECVLNKQDFSQLTSIISESLNSSVFLTNDSFELLSHTMSPETMVSFPFSFSRNLFYLFPETDSIMLREKANTDKLPIMHFEKDNLDTKLLFNIFPIRNNHALIGFIVILEEPQTIQTYYNVISNLSSVFCIAMINHSVMTESERSNKDIFFFNLLQGKITSTRQLESLCMKNGFDYNVRRFCIVMQPKELAVSSRKHSIEQNILNTLTRNIDDSLFTYVSNTFQGNVVLFLFPKNGKNNNNSYMDIITELCSDIQDNLSKINIHALCGISKPLKGAGTIRTTYNQAISSVRVGTSIHPDQTIYNYNDDEIYHVMLDSFSNAQRNEIYNDLIGKLVKYDKLNESDLVATLETYIHCQQNAAQAARKLFIHRNTMQYRLEQIKNILGMDINDTHNVYKLQTAFYIKDILTI